MGIDVGAREREKERERKKRKSEERGERKSGDGVEKWSCAATSLFGVEG